ncbi:MAG: zinc transporter ZupT [Arcticibacterium sp.]|jgi:zinc transporter ZupT
MVAPLPYPLSDFIVMPKKNTYTLGLLIVLTILTAVFSNINSNLFYVTAAIMLLSGIKFLLVAFNFMELGKANTFWKLILILFLVIYFAIVLFAV